MKTTLKTTLALLFAGVIHSFGQTHDEAIIAHSSQPDISFTSEEAIALKDAVLAEPAVSDIEAKFVFFCLSYSGQTIEQMTPTIASLEQKGSAFAGALVRLWGLSFNGWTADMIRAADTGAVCVLALRENAPPEFRNQVFNALKETANADTTWLILFKLHRGALPVEQQIQLTANEKRALLMVPVRTDAQNTALASYSADLVALQLDQ